MSADWGDFVEGSSSFNSASNATESSKGASGGTMGSHMTNFIFDTIGQEQANIANRKAARTQMQFQRNMSGTAWQRGVGDMIAAGINPMLAVSKGGASSPEGAMARNESITARGISSAMQGKLLDAQLAKLGAETENVRMDTTVKAREEQYKMHDTVRVMAEYDRLVALVHNLRAELPKIEHEAEKVRLEQRLVIAESRLRELEGVHSALDIPRASAESNISDSPYGRYGRPLLKDVSSLVGSAASAAGGVAAARFAVRGVERNRSGLRRGAGKPRFRYTER